MLRPGIPEKAIKASQQETRGTHKNNKTRPSQRIGGLITSQPIRSMGTYGMTLLAVGYHARVVALGCMAKRKGVSSRANLLISVKVLVGNIATTGHHARAVSPD
jgi:hypothetical protein